MVLIVYRVFDSETYILDGRLLSKRDKIVRQVKYNEDFLNWLSRNTEISEVYVLEEEGIDYYRKFSGDLCWAPLIQETPCEEDYEDEDIGVLLEDLTRLENENASLNQELEILKSINRELREKFDRGN